MRGSIRAVLFDYGETLVRNWPSAGMSRPEPGVHAALRRLAPEYRLAIAANDETPAAAIREDLARLGLADLFTTVQSAGDTSPPSWTATMERALADLDVGSAEAVLISGREGAPPLPDLRVLRYRPDNRWGSGLLEMNADDPEALASFDDLRATLASVAAGVRRPRSWQSAARLIALVLGFALGTAAVLYLRQRQEADLGAADVQLPDSNERRSDQS